MFRSADQIGNSFGIYAELKLMPRDIVSKFCFLLGKCGQQVDIRRIIRDIYLFEVELKLLFSSLLGRRNGAFWGYIDTICQR